MMPVKWGTYGNNGKHRIVTIWSHGRMGAHRIQDDLGPCHILKDHMRLCQRPRQLGHWVFVIGVEEKDGRPVLPVRGIPESQVDEVMKDLLNKCKLITPEYLPVVAPVLHQGKTLVVAQCSDGSWRPYSCPARFTQEKGKAIPSKERAYFIRKMSSTVQAQGQELQDLFELASRIPFDDRTNHEASMTDLSITLIKSYFAEAGSDLAGEADALPFDELCRDMGICTITPEYVRPRNVGLLFISMSPEKYVPYAQIDVVQFPDGAGGDEIIERIFTGRCTSSYATPCSTYATTCWKSACTSGPTARRPTATSTGPTLP